MAVIQQQDFNATDGADLANRSMTIGGGTLECIDTNRVLAFSGRARLSDAASSGACRFPSLGSTQNYEVRATIRLIANTGSPSLRLGARCNGFSFSERFDAIVTPTGITLEQWIGFSNSTLGTYSFSFATGTNYTLGVVCNGTAISVRLDGSTVIGPVTGDAGVDSTNVVLELNQSPNGSTTSGWHVDLMEVDDTIPGSGPSAAARARYRRLANISPF